MDGGADPADAVSRRLGRSSPAAASAGCSRVAFHPQYASNGFFFVYYTNTAGDIDDRALPDRRRRTRTWPTRQRRRAPDDPAPVNANHNGGQLQFGPDGYLYIGTGDGGSGNDPPCNAQNDDMLLGKLLRIDVDQNVSTPPFYGIPPSNPFAAAGAARATRSGRRACAIPGASPSTARPDDLWIGDVGQGAREEIDFQPRASAGGENYGWKIMEGNHCGDGGSSGCPAASRACNSPRLPYRRSTSTATPAAAAR